MVWTHVHIGKMNNNKKKLSRQNQEGKRSKGRPRTRWLDQIREDIEDRGQTWTEIHKTKTWGERDGWRSLSNG